MDKVIPPELAGLRLDRVLHCLFPGHSRAELQGLIEGGAVFLNGEEPKKRFLVKEGDRVALTIRPRSTEVSPQAM